MMDNGYNRILSDNSICGDATCYTTFPVLTVNESAKTASFTFHDQLPQNMYSFWGGAAPPSRMATLNSTSATSPTLHPPSKK